MAGWTCYYPDQAIATTYSPCFNTSSGNFSSCCELSTSVCTEGGYCYGGAGLVYRGGCTDKSWKSTSCPYYCSADSIDSSSNIVPCPGSLSYTGGGSFCCAGYTEYNSTCCDRSFLFRQSDVGLPFVPNSAGVLVTSSATSSSLSTLTAPSASPTASGTASPSSTAGKAPTVSFAVGIALGVIALTAVIASLFLFGAYRRKSKSIASLSTSGARPSRNEGPPPPPFESGGGAGSGGEVQEIILQQHDKPELDVPRGLPYERRYELLGSSWD